MAFQCEKKNVAAQKGVEKHCSRLSQVLEAVYKISVLLPFVQIFFPTDFNVYVITLKPHTITTCVFTVELTSDQLHTQRARPAADHRDDADELGDDGRVKQVGLCAVVICVSMENLQHTDVGPSSGSGDRVKSAA